MQLESVKDASILIVEDNNETLTTIFNALHGAGLKPLIARDGIDALNQVALAQPDLILLDILLPGLNGFEVCRRLKASAATQDIPVIIITALQDATDKLKGFEAGAVDYITKPLDHGELIARITTHVTLKQFRQQLEVQNALLQEQNVRFRQLADATFEGIVLHDNAAILDVNQVFERCFGYQREEVNGRHLSDFIAPEFRERIRQHLGAADESIYEAIAVHKTMTSFPVAIQARTMPYNGRQICVAAIRDLTQQKKLEQEKIRLEKENITLKTATQDRYRFGEMIGKSPAMQAIYDLIAHAAAAETNVVIYGETGVGKELIARAIHQRSDRSARAFVAVNCGAIPENLFEREFFGHRKGAFTGADRDTQGYLDRAQGGTVFLDEVGELTPPLQVKLLRVLEQREYLPVGSNTPKPLDVRILAATNQPPEIQLREGKMRSDFFYRLAVMTIFAPPLRERRDDLPFLIDHFLTQLCAGAPRPIIPDRILQALYRHDWPGNVRELQNVLQHYLTTGSLRFPGSHASPSSPAPHAEASTVPSEYLQEALDAFEKDLLRQALEQHRWHKGQTAAALGLERKTLYRKMRKYNLG